MAVNVTTVARLPANLPELFLHCSGFSARDISFYFSTRCCLGAADGAGREAAVERLARVAGTTEVGACMLWAVFQLFMDVRSFLPSFLSTFFCSAITFVSLSLLPYSHLWCDFSFPSSISDFFCPLSYAIYIFSGPKERAWISCV